MRKFIFTLLIVSMTIVTMQAQKMENIAPTPPMGWNSWNFFGKHEINETIIKECMDAMVKNGLVKAGYNYFVIDGGWRDTFLNEDGTLRAHPKKFPNGIKPLADYAHSLGLKFGLHTVPGSRDCAGDLVGAYGIEEIHIQQFIDWGLDFIKVDRCILDVGCEGKCWTEENIEEAYRRWRTILDEKKSKMLLSVSAYKFRPWNVEICNMSRTTGDISCRVTKGAFFTEEERTVQGKPHFSVIGIAETNNESASYAKPGYWNDPDMLVTGDNGLTFEEQKTHFALWCVMSSPLLLGNDPRNISKEEASIILNKTAIKINQDPTEQGIKINSIKGIDYWKKNLKDGSCALVAFNRTLKEDITFDLNLKELGIKNPKKVYDVYTSKKFKYRKNKTITLAPHACKFFLITK